MKRKKKFFTLLEVVLAVFLTGLILSALWELHHRYYLGYKKIQILQAQTEKKLFLHQRMKTLLATIANQSQKARLFTPGNLEAPSFAFCYEQAADQSPALNGPVCSLLYIDSQKRLCLCTWPENQSTSRIEILHDSVLDLRLFFFHPEAHIWQESWHPFEEQNPLPLWMKMEISFQKNKTETFIYKVINPTTPILYQSIMQNT
jgi:hypothetical protein